MKAFLLAICISAAAVAQTSQPTELAVADGSGNKVYKRMFGELMQYCGTEQTGLTVSEVDSPGTLGNLQRVLDNKANAAFLHDDVIFYHNITDKIINKVQTLVALYPEEVHYIALRDSKAQTDGHFGFGRQTIVFNEIKDLKGRKVGAIEGSAISADIIQSKLGIGYETVDYPDGRSVIAALDSGEIDAWVTVGGAPLDNVEQLDGKRYKLLPILDTDLPRLQEVFKSARITYPKLSRDPVTTVAADAVLVTRKYKNPKMNEALGKLRQCFYDHLGDLQETRGMHPKWATVDPDDQGKWIWYDLPGDTRQQEKAGQSQPPSQHPTHRTRK